MSFSSQDQDEYESILTIFTRVLSAFVSAESLREKLTVLERERELLLTDVAEGILARLMKEDRERGNIHEANHLQLHLEMLRGVREVGIAAAWERFGVIISPEEEREAKILNIYRHWLSISTYREACVFLEEHPELLDSSLDSLLESSTTEVEKKALSTLKKEGNEDELRRSLREIYDRLDLLRRIWKRGGVAPAVREEYVNAYGGFALGVPSWLGEIEQQLIHMRQQEHPDHKAIAGLLQDAIKHAQKDFNITPEMLAELHNSLGLTLYQWQDDRKEAIDGAIAAYKVALQVYIPTRYPYRYAMTQHDLGNAYCERIEGEQSTNREEAISYYKGALQICTYEYYPVAWVAIHGSLGKVYRERIVGERRANLEQALAHYQATLQVSTIESAPMGWAMTLWEWAATLRELCKAYQSYTGEERQDNLERSIKNCETSLQIDCRSTFPEVWATLQRHLGFAYAERVAGELRTNLEQAVLHCEAALQVYTREDFPNDWALVQLGLGSIYSKLTEGERRTNLEQAITHYKLALEVYTRGTFPVYWAETQQGLGLAYIERIEEKRRINLEQAIGHFETALQVYTHDAFPRGWAMLQCYLGNVYLKRIEGERHLNIEQAITLYQAASQVYTRDTFPSQWAMIHHNLGTAYYERIEGERRVNIEQAIAHNEAAQQVYTRNAFPHEWALVMRNLGIAYSERYEGRWVISLERAIVCFEAAQQVHTRDTFPYKWARIQYNLGQIYGDRVAGEKRANLEQARAYLEAALQVYTREAFPYDWAYVQNALGNIYQERIEGDRRTNLEQARTYFEASLEVLTLDISSFGWADPQNNLGNVYRERLEGDRKSNLAQARACYDAVLQVYTCEAFPLRYRRTQLSCALTEAERQNWLGVHNAYQEAQAAEEILARLGTGITGHDDVILRGGDASIRDGFALVRLARIKEAAVAIERGRARSLTEALVLDTADPAQIRDPQRRECYCIARQQLIAAQVLLNRPLPAKFSESERRQKFLESIETFSKAQEGFNSVIADIRQAQDPPDFLNDILDGATIMRASERGGPGHALVYIVSTPWGGFAVGVFSANPDLNTSARFMALDLPKLTEAAVQTLVETKLRDEEGPIIGGYLHAQERNGFLAISGDEPEQSWKSKTFREVAAALHRVCIEEGKMSMLDLAAQRILNTSGLRSLIDRPMGILTPSVLAILTRTLEHYFLQLELQHCLNKIAELAMRPLMMWLGEQGTTSLTLIPCGRLAIFPLASIPMADSHAKWFTLPTSIAPSARSLLQTELSSTKRQGVYALGNPTAPLLPWGEAEAFTIAKLARKMKLEGGGYVKVQSAATRHWLVRALQKGIVVDVSCHGYFDTGDFLASSLYLAQEQQMQLRDLISHEVDLRGLRLLILSACQTSVVHLRGAVNEMHSLAVGALWAGADAVLASLWPVDDRATYLLIVRFAQEWFPGMKSEPPAVALERAQHWLRTVTNKELERWEAKELPIITSVEKKEAGLDSSVEAMKVVGRVETTLQDAVAVGTHSYRHDIWNAQQLLRSEAKKNHPDERPFADPIYWAGFQITGW